MSAARPGGNAENVAEQEDRRQITDEAVAELRSRVGREVRQPDSAFEFVTADAMRNYARGIGDINPMYRDVEYARSSPLGVAVAHPTFMLFAGVPGPVSSQSPPSGDPLAGVHAFYSGEDIRWFRRVVEGQRLVVTGGLAAVEVKESRRGGQAVHEIRERVFRDAEGIVGVSRERIIRIGRSASRERAGEQREAVRDVPHRYSEEEMAGIEAAYEAEMIRGAEPRHWEDVQVGDAPTPLIKGPYTVTAYICFAEGTGPRNKFHRAHSDAFAYRRKHPRAFPINSLGFPDTIARVHWDRELALRAGLRETYDYGGERVAWLSHAVTNWMGDTGFLEHLDVRMTGFCFVGDTVRISVRVAATPTPGRVLLEVEGMNQADELIASARATVRLPLRGADLPELPTAGEIDDARIQF